MESIVGYVPEHYREPECPVQDQGVNQCRNPLNRVSLSCRVCQKANLIGWMSDMSRRANYSMRRKVERDFSGFKRVLGEGVRATSREGMFREIRMSKRVRAKKEDDGVIPLP